MPSFEQLTNEMEVLPREVDLWNEIDRIITEMNQLEDILCQQDEIDSSSLENLNRISKLWDTIDEIRIELWQLQQQRQ